MMGKTWNKKRLRGLNKLKKIDRKGKDNSLLNKEKKSNRNRLLN
jgi:hypothetical protein